MKFYVGNKTYVQNSTRPVIRGSALASSHSFYLTQCKHYYSCLSHIDEQPHNQIKNKLQHKIKRAAHGLPLNNLYRPDFTNQLGNEQLEHQWNFLHQHRCASYKTHPSLCYGYNLQQYGNNGSCTNWHQG